MAGTAPGPGGIIPRMSEASKPISSAKRAVLYTRVSSDDRGKDGRNLQGQLEQCRQYAQEKGYAVVAELSEDDRGGSGIVGSKVPQPHDLLLKASCGQPPTVRAYREMIDGAIISEDDGGGSGVVSGEVPEPGCLVVASRHKPSTVRAYSKCGDTVCMASEDTGTCSRVISLKVPESGRAVSASCGEPVTIGAHRD